MAAATSRIAWVFVASALLARPGSALADPIPFSYEGGSLSLAGLLDEAGVESGAFAGAGFAHDMVNAFLVDTGGSALSDAGITLFVMWGNGLQDPPSGYGATGQITAPSALTLGPDDGGQLGSLSSLHSQVFALGPDVSIDSSFAISLTSQAFGIFGATEAPQGLAITNLQLLAEGTLNFFFTTMLGIDHFGLFSNGLSGLPMAGRGGGAGDALAIDLPLATTPLPAPLGLAAVGLVGVVLLRRRWLA